MLRLGNGGGARTLWKGNHAFLAKATWLFMKNHSGLILLVCGEVGKKEKVGGLKDCERHYPG